MITDAIIDRLEVQWVLTDHERGSDILRKVKDKKGSAEGKNIDGITADNFDSRWEVIKNRMPSIIELPEDIDRKVRKKYFFPKGSKQRLRRQLYIE